MNSLKPESVHSIFQSKPEEAATWLVAFDSLAAVYPITKHRNAELTTSYRREVAAQRIVSSLGNGDYASTFNYFTSPEKYPPSMKELALQLGAVSLRGQLDPAFMAAVSYKLDKNIRRKIPDNAQVLRLYENAHMFPLYFQGLAEQRFTSSEYASLPDFVLMIKNETSLWIDQEPTT